MLRQCFGITGKVILGLLCAGVIFSGCGKKEPSSSSSTTTSVVEGGKEESSATIEFMMWGAPDELETVKGYLRQFHRENPGIKVKIIHKNEYYQALQTMFAGGTPPDVMYMGLEDFPDYASRDQLLDLTPLIKRDGFAMDDFYPQLIPNFVWEGRTYGIPKDFTPLVLYYNKDIFDKAGIEPPSANWTWDDFLNTAKKLTRDFDNDGTIDQYGFTVETWFGEWYPWVIQNGGKILSEDRTKWLLGDPKYIDRNAGAIQFLADLIHKYKVSPAANVTRDMEPSSIFKAGKAAMCTYGRWMCMQFKDIKDFAWDVQQLPHKEKRATTLFTVSYAIAASTKHREESWKLVKFLTGPVGQKATARSGHAIPAAKSIAESPDFLQAPAIGGEINARVFLDSVEYATPTPTNLKMSKIQVVLQRELELVFEGKESARSVIERTQKEIQGILDGND